MRRYIKQLNIHIDPAFYFLMAVAILIIPAPWVVSWLIASMLHELGHYIAIRICGFRVYCLKIGCGGAKIYTQPLLNREGFCALAGPLAGFVLVLFVKWIPRIALCGVIQSVFNLLPIGEMDGARVLKGVLYSILPQSIADVLLKIACTLTLTTLLLVSVCVFSIDFGILPIVMSFAMIVNKRKRKFSCKDDLLQVQ